MPHLVDYKCRTCSGRAEHWTTQPIPPSQPCAACGGEARRLFGIARVNTSTSATTGGNRQLPSGKASTARDDAVACLQNSRAPGACHMHPSAARRWSAMGRGDTQAVEREIEYQENAIKAGTLSSSDAFTHSHAPAGAVAAAGASSTSASTSAPSPTAGAHQHTAGES